MYVDGGSGFNVGTRGPGDSGGITIEAGGSITFDGVRGDGLSTRVSGTTFGEGNGGDILFEAAEITLSNGAILFNNSLAPGNAGSIALNATESVNIVGTDPEGFSGGLYARSNNLGNSADVTINTHDYNQLDAGYILLTSFGEGNAGNLTINATGDVTIAGTGLVNDPNVIDLAAVGPALRARSR